MKNAMWMLGVSIFGLCSPIQTHAEGAYAATLILDSDKLSVGSTAMASVELKNLGSQEARADMSIYFPPGFSAQHLKQMTCSGSFLQGEFPEKLVIYGARIPVNGVCKYEFTLNVPELARLPALGQVVFLLEPESGVLATMKTGAAPKITGFLGATPGLYSETKFPTEIKSVAYLDFFITPETDPGPYSNIFWANDLHALNAYTGLQSTSLADPAGEGVGKQFLFSIWGKNTRYHLGTPSSKHIGSGSHCKTNDSAADGSPGSQCRFRYEWQSGHTYRFRVAPDKNLGPGWFKSSVTDVTVHDGISFDIGSLYTGTNDTEVPVSAVGQWTEYFDWSDPRTGCASIAYSRARVSIKAYDALGKEIKLPRPAVKANTTCPPEFSTVAEKNGEALLIGGPNQSAEGLLKFAGVCLSVPDEPRGGAALSSEPCPTHETVLKSGGYGIRRALWVLAGDGTIQTKQSYCLTAHSKGNVTLETCDSNNALPQHWSIRRDASHRASIISKLNGQCLAPAGSLVTLRACSERDGQWAVPGKSFEF